MASASCLRRPTSHVCPLWRPASRRGEPQPGSPGMGVQPQLHGVVGRPSASRTHGSSVSSGNSGPMRKRLDPCRSTWAASGHRQDEQQELRRRRGPPSQDSLGLRPCLRKSWSLRVVPILSSTPRRVCGALGGANPPPWLSGFTAILLVQVQVLFGKGAPPPDQNCPCVPRWRGRGPHRCCRGADRQAEADLADLARADLAPRRGTLRSRPLPCMGHCRMI